MSSKTIKNKINDLVVVMKGKDEPKCIEMMNELAKIVEFNVDPVYYIKDDYYNINSLLLHKSCKYGLLEVSKHLIDYFKADVNTQDNIRDTALHIASRHRHIVIVRHLIDNATNIDVNIQNIYGNTALHIASFHGHFDIVRYLIYNTNINVNIQNVDGNTALHSASFHGHFDIVRYLIDNTNVDVNIRDENGSTALHHACYSNKCGVVLELLKCNRVDVFIENDRNETAEQVARRMGYHDIAELIANYEPNINFFDNK